MTAGTAGTGAAMECSWPAGYTGPPLGKCVAGCAVGTDCGVTTSTGGFFTLDDFEGTPSSGLATVPLNWPSRDGRIGSWHSYAATGATATIAIAAAGSGGSPDSKQAIHYSGTTGSYGATLSLSLTCYDASAYDGISFWVKGTAAAGNAQVRFNVQTPVTEPVVSGGVCTAGCYGHFGKTIDLTAGWTRYKIPWADLRMPSCAPPTPPIPAKFDPQKMILALSFTQVDPTKGFDFWVDDITFDVDTRPTDKFSDMVTQPVYNEIFKFKTPLPVFSYAGLVAAVTANGQSALAQTGTPADRKHEAAGLLAQMSQETGGLTVVRETACSPTMTPQCTTYGTADQNYYGRGAIQLTYQANYAAANAAFPGISANPDLVASMTDFAFGTAVWFWMNKGCHTAMVSGGKNFGDTTRIINGGLECSGGPNTTGAKARADLYTAFSAALGVNPTGQLLCP
jgi:predicted chitinase